MKTAKKLTALLLAVAMILSLAACGAGKTTETSPSASAAATDSTTVTVTDHAGNQVTVPKNAQRIAVCDIYPLPSVLSVFFDSADRIVGMPEKESRDLLDQIFAHDNTTEQEVDLVVQVALWRLAGVVGLVLGFAHLASPQKSKSDVKERFSV